MSAVSGSLSLESLSGSPMSGSSPESKKSKEKESAKLAFPCPEFLAFQEKFLKPSPKGETCGINTALIKALLMDVPYWIFDARHFIELLILMTKKPVFPLIQSEVSNYYLNKNKDFDYALDKLKEMLESLDKKFLEQYGKTLMLGLTNAIQFVKDGFQVEKLFSFIGYLIYEKNISPNFYLNGESPFYTLVFAISRSECYNPQFLSILEQRVLKFTQALIQFKFDFNSLPQGQIELGGNNNDSPLHFVMGKLVHHPIQVKLLPEILSLQANPLLISVLDTRRPEEVGCALSSACYGTSISTLPILYQYGAALMNRKNRKELTRYAYYKQNARLEDEIYFPFSKPDDSSSFDYVTDIKAFAERLSLLEDLEEIDRLSVVCQNVLQADPKVLAEGVLTAVERNKDAIINCRSNLYSGLQYIDAYTGVKSIIKGYLTSQSPYTPKMKM